MVNGVCPWPAGKGTGGGTILNALVYTRGIAKDYDGWAAEGNQGWSYKEIFPYFMKAEKTLSDEIKQSEYHGEDGWLPISYSPNNSPLGRAYVEAGKRLGYKEIDYNNPKTPLGFARVQLTMDRGQRVSASTAYLRPIIGRSNLYITLRSRATKLLFDTKNKKVIGIIYVQNGREYTVYAKKEVILAAGAFNTPQLLMLSGIGPAEHLKEMEIPVIHNLPVGDNLMEHIGMHGLVFLVDQPVTAVLSRSIGQLFQWLISYMLSGNGMWSSPGCEGIGFIRTKYANDSDNVPDIELLFVEAGFNTDSGALFRKSFGISDELYESVYRQVDGYDSFSIWPMLLYPRSRGKVRLKNKNPFSKVKIISNFLEEDIDKEILVEGIKAAVKVAESEPLKKFGARLYTEPFPECAHFRFASDEYWGCTVEVMTTQFHHQSGTCGMGSVVDSRLRVIGVPNLRVVDVSIMPKITAGHTQAPAYMIGEKAADIIKEEWKIY